MSFDRGSATTDIVECAGVCAVITISFTIYHSYANLCSDVEFSFTMYHSYAMLLLLLSFDRGATTTDIAAKRRASWGQCAHEIEKSQGSGDFDFEICDGFRNTCVERSF